MEVHKEREYHGGLVGINQKDIEDSYAVSSCRGGGVCGTNYGRIARCYGDYSGQSISAVTKGAERASMVTKSMKGTDNWDFQRIWKRNQKGLPVFREENWIYELAMEEYETVSTAEELFSLAKRIEEGDKAASRTNIRLTCDIHFRNRRVIPIGTIDNPYRGIFDGAGFTVSGFRIEQGDNAFAGFFGRIVSATVANLTVDGRVTGGLHTGILCGQNEHSDILCCGAVGECSGHDNVGGLCGTNNGVIKCCNFYGYVKQVKPKRAVWILLGVILLEILLLAGLIMKADLQKQKIVFVPTMVDSNIKKTSESMTEPGVHSENHITIQVQQKAWYTMGEDHVSLEMTNPAESNQIAMIELLLPRNYRELNGVKYGFDQQEAYEVVASTGGIPPGYLVEQLDYIGFPGRTELEPGSYQAFIRISFYDVESNEKAMLDSVFGIELSVMEGMEMEAQ